MEVLSMHNQRLEYQLKQLSGLEKRKMLQNPKTRKQYIVRQMKQKELDKLAQQYRLRNML